MFFYKLIFLDFSLIFFFNFLFFLYNFQINDNSHNRLKKILKTIISYNFLSIISQIFYNFL